MPKTTPPSSDEDRVDSVMNSLPGSLSGAHVSEKRGSGFGPVEVQHQMAKAEKNKKHRKQ